MPAPTKYPDWATDGTNVVEPPAGKVTAGWVPGEQPPAGWFNAWQALVGQWVRWFDEAVNDLLGRVSAVEPIAADAALKSAPNTFTQPQTIPQIAGGVAFAGKLTANAGIDVMSGSVYTVGNVEAALAFQYSPAPTRTKAISPNDFVGDSHFPGQELVRTPSQKAMAVLHVPHGGELGQMKIKVEAQGGDLTMTTRLLRRQPANWATAAKPTYTVVKTWTTPTLTVAMGVQNLAVAELNWDWLSVSKDETYELEVTNNNTSTGTLYLYAAEIQFTDPGPRNH